LISLEKALKVEVKYIPVFDIKAGLDFLDFGRYLLGSGV
jgi:hypothetical protein